MSWSISKNISNKKEDECLYNKIQVCSDLHLDQLDSYESFKLVFPYGKILIMAGDICHNVNLEKHKSFFSFVSEKFEYVIYIPGNHEFYNDLNLTLSELEYRVNIFLKNYNNIYYLNNQSIVINRILFTGSCLWCFPSSEPPPWFKLNLSKDELCHLYKDSLNYLNKISSLNYNNHVIITHYPPLFIDNFSRDNFSRDNTKKTKYYKYKEYYQNETILLKNMPKFWVFGHIHQNYIKFIDKTMYISNQYKSKCYNDKFLLSF